MGQREHKCPADHPNIFIGMINSKLELLQFVFIYSCNQPTMNDGALITGLDSYRQKRTWISEYIYWDD